MRKSLQGLRHLGTAAQFSGNSDIAPAGATRAADRRRRRRIKTMGRPGDRVHVGPILARKTIPIAALVPAAVVPNA
jgi:hypothetical protein